VASANVSDNAPAKKQWQQVVDERAHDAVSTSLQDTAGDDLERPQHLRVYIEVDASLNLRCSMVASRSSNLHCSAVRAELCCQVGQDLRLGNITPAAVLYYSWFQGSLAGLHRNITWTSR